MVPIRLMVSPSQITPDTFSFTVYSCVTVLKISRLDKSYSLGMSGNVIMDDTAGREPSFVLKGFGKDGKQYKYLLAEMYKPEGQVPSRNIELTFD